MCPHCNTAFHTVPSFDYLGEDAEAKWFIEMHSCPECHKDSFYLVKAFQTHTVQGQLRPTTSTKRLVRPHGMVRPLPSEVPHAYAQEFQEACAVVPDSAKASAALSRRLLQRVLREQAGIQESNLSDEIQQVIDGAQLPSRVAEALDAVREIGNFGAHPMKSQSTGEILAVEPEEAEWNLDVLESLFDFYFVMPTKLEAKKALLNEKLKEAGRREV